MGLKEALLPYQTPTEGPTGFKLWIEGAFGFLDDFNTGIGYVRDDALANESDPCRS